MNRHVTDATLEELAAEVVSAWQDDARVRSASTTFTRDPATGQVVLRASILTPPLLGETIDFTTRL